VRLTVEERKSLMQEYENFEDIRESEPQEEAEVNPKNLA
jgi:hypothetical protein